MFVAVGNAFLAAGICLKLWARCGILCGNRSPLCSLERFAKGLVELEYCFNPSLHLVLSHWVGPVALGGLLIGVPFLA